MRLVPFCPCMFDPIAPPEFAEGGDLSWRDGEYDVLDLGQVYAAVSEHRRACQLQPDLYVTARARR